MTKRAITYLLMFLMSQFLVACSISSAGVALPSQKTIVVLQEQQAMRTKINNLSLRETYTRSFKDNAYLEDFEETKKRLERQATEYYQQKVVGLVEKFHIMASLDLEYSLLKTARDKDLSYEDIVTSYESQINEIYLTSFISYKGEDYQKKGVMADYADVFRKALIYDKDNMFKKPIYLDSMTYCFTEDVIELPSDITVNETIKHYYDQTNKDSYFALASAKGLINYGATASKLKDMLEGLENKYQEEFILVRVKDNKHFFAPRRRPHLVFEMNHLGDAYLSVLGQDFLYQEVKKLTDKYDDIGVFTAFPIEKQIRNTTKSVLSYEDFSHEATSFITLYYMVDDDPIDEQLILDLSSEITSKLFAYKGQEVLYIVPLRTSSSKKENFLKLLEEHALSENYMRTEEDGGSWAVTRNDSQAFRYMDLYIDSPDLCWRIDKELSDESSLEVLDVLKMKNIYERYD